jgi:TolA-binding protein
LADNPPHNLYRIADCFASQGKLDQAVGQLREIENFFKNNASDAALRIAYLYRDAGKRDLYVASLRNVLKKYPKSGESSRAHEELEKLGERIGGGVDADKPITEPAP